MKRQEKTYRQVRASVPGDFAREIRRYAKRRGLSLQQLIREALERKIARSTKADGRP